MAFFSASERMSCKKRRAVKGVAFGAVLAATVAYSGEDCQMNGERGGAIADAAKMQRRDNPRYTYDLMNENKYKHPYPKVAHNFLKLMRDCDNRGQPLGLNGALRIMHDYLLKTDGDIIDIRDKRQQKQAATEKLLAHIVKYNSLLSLIKKQPPLTGHVHGISPDSLAKAEEKLSAQTGCRRSFDNLCAEHIQLRHERLYNFK